MDIIDAGLRLLGAFYVFAGYIATRAALTSHVLDRAIAGIGGRGLSGVERAATAWHLVGATLVLASGIALVLLTDVAPVLFVASAVMQAAYIGVVAPRWFDVEDPPDPKGRRQTTNAFLIYSLATSLVIWAGYRGRLSPLVSLDWPWLAAACAALVWHGVTLVRGLSWPSKEQAGAPPTFDQPEIDEAELARRVQRLEVRAVRECHPLWALDEGLYGDFPPAAIGLSAELSRDLVSWVEELTARQVEAEEAGREVDTTVWTAHQAQGRVLAERLARERPDLTVCVADDDGALVEVRV
jgi:hypothetical protein